MFSNPKIIKFLCLKHYKIFINCMKTLATACHKSQKAGHARQRDFLKKGMRSNNRHYRQKGLATGWVASPGHSCIKTNESAATSCKVGGLSKQLQPRRPCGCSLLEQEQSSLSFRRTWQRSCLRLWAGPAGTVGFASGSFPEARGFLLLPCCLPGFDATPQLQLFPG